MSAVRNMFGALSVLLPLDFKFVSVDQPRLVCLVFNICRSQPEPYRAHSLCHFFLYGATAPSGPGFPHYRDYMITRS
jgi:hypothetical protein